MATYPIKVLLDRNRQPFIPFSTTSSIVENGTNRRLDKILGNLDDLQTNNKNSLVSAINEILTQHGSGGSSTGWQVVDKLPTENISATTIYLVHKEGAKKPNIYEEWIWVNNDWENIGTTEIDLSGYATTTMIGDLNTLQTTDKDNLVDAINEIVGTAGGTSANIGNLNNLITEDKSSLVNAINEVANYKEITELTDETIDLRTLDKGVYIVSSSVNKIKCGSYSSTTFDISLLLNHDKDRILLVGSDGTTYNTGYLFAGSRIVYLMGFGSGKESYIITNMYSLSEVLPKNNTKSYTPTGDYNPATKKYVDDAVAAGAGGGSAFDPAKYLAIDNTTEYTPTDLYHPATKAYVDSQIASVPEPIDAYSKTEIDGKLSNYLSKTNTESYTPTSDYHPATKKFVESVVSSIDMSGYYNKTDVDSMIGNVTKNNITFWNVAWKSSPYYILPSTGAYVNLVGYSADDKVTMYSHVSTNKYMTTTSGENYIAAFKFTEPVTLKNVVTVKTKTKLGSSDYTGHTLIYHSSDNSNMVIQPTYKDVEYGASDSDGFFDTIVTSYYDIKDTNLNKLLELYRYVAVGENFDEGGSNITCKKLESSWEII